MQSSSQACRTKVRRDARRWTKASARLNPGIKFIALVDGQLHTAEVGPGLYPPLANWPENVELGFKDGAAGRWVWNTDLDRFTQGANDGKNGG